jgi:L-Ala-D/L-Glu epimerase
VRVRRIALETMGGACPSLTSALGAWKERRGLALRLEDEAGNLGEGEASPLPGYSPDALSAVEQTLRRLSPEALTLDDEADLGAVAELVRRLVPAKHPSARFALETALADLLARRRGLPLWRWLGAESPAPIPLSALIDEVDVHAARDHAERMRALGVQTFKLKIARPGHRDAEAALARALRAHLGTGVRLRLDANGALSSHDAASHLAAFADLDVELIEEPVPFDELEGAPRLPIPLAFDESLARPTFWERFDAWEQRDQCVALVLKPALLGGLGACQAAAHQARQRGLDVTISHLFDGPLALAACAALALAIASPERASGLAPHAALAAFPHRPLPQIEGAFVRPLPEPGLGLSRGLDP